MKHNPQRVRRPKLRLLPPPRPAGLTVEGEKPSYYTVGDDFILLRDTLLEIVWSTFRPGELHTIELIDGRVIVRYVIQITLVRGEEALEIDDSDGQRALLPRRLVKRVGAVSRLLYGRRKSVSHGQECRPHGRVARLAPAADSQFDFRGERGRRTVNRQQRREGCLRPLFLKPIAST